MLATAHPAWGDEVLCEWVSAVTGSLRTVSGRNGVRLETSLSAEPYSRDLHARREGGAGMGITNVRGKDAYRVGVGGWHFHAREGR